MRHVTALKKEEETTKRLAEMLRPVARRALESLKKDVPAAYQEKSTAHPYLPFFHRLESCLKHMATYDPEEVDEDVTVLSVSAMSNQSRGKTNETKIICLLDSAHDGKDTCEMIRQKNAFIRRLENCLPPPPSTQDDMTSHSRSTTQICPSVPYRFDRLRVTYAQLKRELPASAVVVILAIVLFSIIIYHQEF